MIQDLGLIVDGATATGALANPTVATVNKPTGNIHEINDKKAARLVMAGSNADNETVNYQVILWFQTWPDGADKYWTPVIVAKGAYTLGATALATSVIAANGFIADTVTDTLAQPGSVVISPEDDSVASLTIDLRDADLIEVQTDLGTAAAAYVFIQLAEEVGSFVDITMSATGLATETTQAAMAADITQMNAFTASGKTVEDLEYVSIAQSGAGVAAIKPDTANFHWYLMGLWGTVDTAATTIQLREADDSPVYGGAMEFNDKNGLVLAVTGYPYIITADGKGIEMNCAVGGFNGTAIVLKVAD